MNIQDWNILTKKILIGILLVVIPLAIFVGGLWFIKSVL